LNGSINPIVVDNNMSPPDTFRDQSYEKDVNSNSDKGKNENLNIKMDDGIMINNDFRGFSTSFSHSFVHSTDDEKSDICSLVCCGVLQSERNQYLLTGRRPNDAALPIRFTFFMVLPVTLFAMGLTLLWQNNSYTARNSSHDYKLGIIFVCFISLYATILIIRKSWHQFSNRRDLLKIKENITIPRNELNEQGKITSNEDTKDSPMGQSDTDIYCAHAPCGYYQGDILFEEAEAPLPEDMCSCMWQLYMALCCASGLDYFLQFCGICAIAQESRELNRMYSPHHRAIDYITMEPILDYYRPILELRILQNLDVKSHILTLSKLSYYLVQFIAIGYVAIALFCLFFDRGWLKSLGVVTLTTAVSIFFLLQIHFRYTKIILSIDAIIKSFACGLFITSSMCLPFLLFVSFFFDVIITVILKYWDSDFYISYNSYGYGDGTVDNGSSLHLTPWKTANGSMMSKSHPLQYLVILLFQCFVVSFIEELVKYLAFQITLDHPDFLTKMDLEKLMQATKEELSTIDNEGTTVESDIPIEAHVRPLSSRAMAVLIAAISLSIGFASAEVFIYTCVHHTTSISWLDVLSRMLIWSIHPICAAWQADGMCQRSLELKKKVTIGLIICPAIFLHALFDFAVIFGDFLAENKTDNSMVKILSRFLTPAFVWTIGIVWLLRSLNHLLNRLDDKDINCVDDTSIWRWHSSKLMNPRLLQVLNEQNSITITSGTVEICGTSQSNIMSFPYRMISKITSMEFAKNSDRERITNDILCPSNEDDIDQISRDQSSMETTPKRSVWSFRHQWMLPKYFHNSLKPISQVSIISDVESSKVNKPSELSDTTWTAKTDRGLHGALHIEKENHQTKVSSNFYSGGMTRHDSNYALDYQEINDQTGYQQSITTATSTNKSDLHGNNNQSQKKQDRSLLSVLYQWVMLEQEKSGDNNHSDLDYQNAENYSNPQAKPSTISSSPNATNYINFVPSHGDVATDGKSTIQAAFNSRPPNIRGTKTIHDILRDIESKKSSTIFRPGTWEVEENSKANSSGYTSPNSGDRSPLTIV
jgi:RsiW-degrading membrane proteinase PrsW (M82 family)